MHRKKQKILIKMLFLCGKIMINLLSANLCLPMSPQAFYIEHVLGIIIGKMLWK